MGKGRVSGKKTIDKKEYDNTSFSMNTGLIATTIVIISIVKDFLMYFEVGDSNIIGICSALVVAVISFIVIYFNVSERFRNRKNIRKVIDLWTAYSMVVFCIENLLLINIAGQDDKVIGLLLLAVILVLGLGFALWTLLFEKDRNYNVD